MQKDKKNINMVQEDVPYRKLSWVSKIGMWHSIVFVLLILVVASVICVTLEPPNRNNGVILGATTDNPEELVLVRYSQTKFLEHWKNSIDGDLDGINGTTLARVISKETPQVVYKFKDGETKRISRIRIMSDTNLRKRQRYLVKEFTLEVSTTGDKYVKVLDQVKKKQGDWQTYNFEEVEAKFIRLTLNQSINHEWIQIGEFEVYSSPGSRLVIQRSDDYSDSYLNTNSQGLNIGKFTLQAHDTDVLLDKIYVDVNEYNDGGTDEISGLYLYEQDVQIAEAVIDSSNMDTLMFDMIDDPIIIPTSTDKEYVLKVDTSMINASTSATLLEGFSMSINSDTIDAYDSSGQEVEVEQAEIFFPNYALITSQPRIIVDNTGDVITGNGIYDLIQVSVKADFEGPIGIYKMSFKVTSANVNVNYFELFEDSVLVATQTDNGVQVTNMGSYDLVEVYFNNAGSLGGQYRLIDAGYMKTYVLSATVSNYDEEFGSSISTLLLGDVEFASEEYGLTANEVDLTENNEFIWSDLSYGNNTTTVTTTKEWVNGYLLDGFDNASSSAKII